MLLRFLLDSDFPSDVVIAATCRTTTSQENREFVSLRYQLACSSVARSVTLWSLEHIDAELYLRTALGDQPTQLQVDSLAERAGGNPFLLVELVDAALADVTRLGPIVDGETPESVRASLRHRIHPLSPVAQMVLEVASVHGVTFSSDLLIATLRVDRDEVHDSLDEILSHRLICSTGLPHGMFRFAHSILRDALYDSIPLRLRQDYHRQIAAHLDTHHAADDPQVLPKLAHHLVAAGHSTNDRRTFDVLLSAAEYSLTLFAYEDAVSRYRQSIAFLPKDDDWRVRKCTLLIALGEAERLSGNGPQALDAYLEAIHLARAVANPTYFAQAALGLSAFSGANPIDEQQVILLNDALNLIGTGDVILRSQLLSALVISRHFAPYLGDAVQMSDEAVLLAERARDDRSLAIAHYARILAMVGQYSSHQVEQASIKATSYATAAGDLGIYFRALAFRYMTTVRDARDLEAERLLGDLSLAATRAPHRRHRWQLAVMRAGRSLMRDEPRIAAAQVQNAYTLGVRLDSNTAEQYLAIQRILIAYLQEDISAFEPQLQLLVRTYPLFAPPRAALALALSGAKQFRHANDVLTWFNEETLRSIPGAFSALTIALVAEASSVVGNLSLSRLAADALHTARGEMITASWGAGAVGAAAFYLALVAWASGDFDVAERELNTAALLEQRSGAQHALRRTRIAIECLRSIRSCPPPDSLRILQDCLQGTVTPDSLVASKRPPPIAASTEHAAQSSGPSAEAAPIDTSSYLFRKDAGVWTIAFEGDSFHIRDQRGLYYIRLLLQFPERDLHVLEIVSPQQAPAIITQAGTEDLRIAGVSQAGIDRVDAEALKQYRQRLLDLDCEISVADEFNDLGRLAVLREEREIITTELARSYGRRGRIRQGGSDVERARVAVRNRISSTLTLIQQRHPRVWRHLSNAIHTGVMCSYRPEVLPPWRFQ
jgi:tetratricopeptide (TPR) repeat protein